VTPARTWGFWTRAKLDILSDYLRAFVVASKRATDTVYLDLFAGRLENEERRTRATISGSAIRALDVEPRLGHVVLFEMPERARELETLREKYPGRDIRVFPGDCNEHIQDALHELQDFDWAPTIAFIDPDGPDTKWTTLEAIARFKRRDKWKAELFMLVPTPAFERMLGIDETRLPAQESTITQFFGNQSWRPIHELRQSGALTALEARDEYVNLMRWRLEADLGYGWTHAFELKSETGKPLYHLVFATDHEAGNQIMRDIFTAAIRKFKGMRADALDLLQRLRQEERTGQTSFGFEVAPNMPDDQLYDPLPPHQPQQYPVES
jgi:three-Cys-motif partner protein